MLSPYMFTIDLPHGIAWQAIHNLDLAGRFLVPQPFTTISFECSCIYVRTSHDESFDLLAHALGWHTDHRRLDHRWMPVEFFFNITRVDIKSATYDQIFLPFNNVHVTIFIKTAHIACAQPTVAQGLLGLFRHVVVFLHDVRAARNDLSHLANRYMLIIFINHQQLDIWKWLANRASFTGHSLAMRCQDSACL